MHLEQVYLNKKEDGVRQKLQALWENQTFEGIRRMQGRLQEEFKDAVAEMPPSERLKLAISLLNVERLGLQKIRFWIDLLGRIMPWVVALAAILVRHP